MINWARLAFQRLTSDQRRTADTHLLKVCIPGLEGIDIYLKDESTQPTGSLKHRVARSLFMHAISSGKIVKDTHVVEASSGNTAISEAYFAKLLELPFTAVMPRNTSQSKVSMIEAFGGRCHFVEDSSQVYDAAQALALEYGGHYMDQFTYAEQASDWRSEDSIAASIFRQMSSEAHPVPHAVVMSAGTGGSAATLGRYIHYKGMDTKLIVTDPENSVFYDSFIKKDRSLTEANGSRIEGIGRPRVEASFLPEVITSMIKVKDQLTLATMYWFEELTGRRVGASTGTNLYGVLEVAAAMKARGEKGSIVTLICDDGSRYADTYWNLEWAMNKVGDFKFEAEELRRYA
ncbi:PLP-dependent cysteine synthase family protein [Pseudomonas sp. RAC1]|uniref:PLP-dependent cysteine synthase family protein n=1 Tax=Pseudomonas sp. RAC1 TaxID=3064900 RepID=UPI00271E3B39|nr:PLP-dependent cysteine synthase family protein [Pseudomonas sp. RAC1]MDV9033031.1 PLP-dependent cysteine synthase family protein [Pseudomonas sp. RAC1]